MRQYELTYLISDDVSESEINKVSGTITGHIVDESGKVLKEESWGRRKLAYPIKKQTFATYITVNFEIEPEKLKIVEREIRLTKEILRHLIIVRDFGKEEIKLTKEDISESADVAEVVGGERSFEAVEGETEESKDLMLKREKQENAEDAEHAELAEVAEEADKAEVTEEKTEIEEKKAETKEKKTKTEEKKEVKEAKEEIVEEKPKEKKKVEKKEKKVEKDTSAEDEAERLAKLDEQLDDLLGDDL